MWAMLPILRYKLMENVHRKSDDFGEFLKVSVTILPVEKHKTKIEELWTEYKYAEAHDTANNFLLNCKNDDDKGMFSNWYIGALSGAEKKLKNKIEELFGKGLEEEANELYSKNIDHIEDNFFLKSKQQARNRRAWEKINLLLKTFQFKQSDKTWIEAGKLLAKDYDYDTLKTKCLIKYFNEKFNLPLDENQASALADMSDNLLVTARAGSGKTRTLIAKAALLVAEYNVESNHILLLAFNTDAAKEMKSRISKICPDKSFNNIRTFHSLACGILDRPDIEQNPERFVGSAIKELLSEDKDFKKGIYQYFKNDIARIENGLTDEEYQSIKEKGVCIVNSNRVYISLDGRYVKSRGEKWIADFLFEHELSHNGQCVWNAYEKPHRNTTADNVRIVKPDFTLGWGKAYSFVLEHWAIDEREFYPDIPIWDKNIITYKKYNELRKIKRGRFRNELIETYPKDMKDGRTEFENRLKKIFEEKNVKCHKKNEQELYVSAFDQSKKRIRNLFLSFIQRCAQKEWNVEKAADEVKNHSCSEIEETFLKAAIKVCRKYYEKFHVTQDDDIVKYEYSMLLPAATKKIKDDCLLKLKSYDGEKLGENNKIKVRDIKFILVDEYQDFSQLFYNFIKVIKEHSGAKLFCVGDDWQAINGFAGSELKFFEEYDSYFKQTNRCNIVTNYRSYTSIVENGNRLMDDGLNEKAKASNKERGEVKKIYIDNYYVDYSVNGSPEDETYICYYSDNNKAVDTKASMALKVLHKILSEPENLKILKSKQQNSEDLKCMILTRNNRLHSFGDPIDKNGRSADKLIEKLMDCFVKNKQFGKEEKDDLRTKIVRKTVHKAKGEEAEIVLILNCCERAFPMLHPDNKLFRIFGVNDDIVFEEERRLFYVALTRAKQKVYLITQKNRESDFLKYLTA